MGRSLPGIELMAAVAVSALHASTTLTSAAPLPVLTELGTSEAVDVRIQDTGDRGHRDNELISDDTGALASRKLLHGCHEPECVRKCPVCTFFGESAVGHCRASRSLFPCSHVGRDGIDGNEGDEGDEGNEGDEGDEGNEGQAPAPADPAAPALLPLTAQKRRRAEPLLFGAGGDIGLRRAEAGAPAAADREPDGSGDSRGYDADVSGGDGGSHGYDDDTYFGEFDGFFVEAGPHIVVDYGHAMAMAPADAAGDGSDATSMTGAARGVLQDASASEEEEYYYVNPHDGSVVMAGPYVYVEYDYGTVFPDYDYVS